MDKKGMFEARKKDDAECHARCVDYLARLPEISVHRIACFRSDRGFDYGVVVNHGPDKVSLWNAFKDKIETFSASEFDRRLHCYDPPMPS